VGFIGLCFVRVLSLGRSGLSYQCKCLTAKTRLRNEWPCSFSHCV